jgi:S-DNA-T family DNA segregation ATPase FtsK/SpoIIIE
MTARPDNIPLRRRSGGDTRPPQEDEAPRPQQRTLNDEHNRLRRFKIIAVLLGITGVLLLIALISYTAKDEANAQLTLKDMVGVIRGDETLRLKFDTTYNWLGLLGAVVAHWMFTSTIGMWSIALPVLMMFWAYDVFRVQRITPLVARRSIVTIGCAVSLSAVLGTLQPLEWFQWLPRESCGAIGQFLGGVTSQFIGRIGSTIVWLAILSFVSIVGFELNVASMNARLRTFLAGFEGLDLRSVFGKNADTTDDDDDALEDEDEETADEVDDLPDTDVPAIKRRTTLGERIQRPILDTSTFDEDEPASVLPRVPLVQPPPAPEGIPAEGRQLSSSVKILRPSKADVPRTEAAIPPPVRPQTSTPIEQPAVDISDIQKKLQELHPKREIALHDVDSEPTIAPVLRSADHDERDEAEEFEQADETVARDIENVPVSVPSPVSIQKPLTVTVQDTLFPVEPEIQLSNRTLYDEEIAYKPPPGNLLVEVKDEAAVDDTELEANARTLQEKLETFRVRIENLTVTPGPVVTQYEFVPASGIKVSQIASLSDDIALALKAQGVRIIAPIPGKGTVGIEIPNNNPSIIRFSSIIKSPKYHNPEIKLPLAMGKTVIGEVFCADLTKMPHLLIAGATGKGKSVGINTIIASLLYRMHPRDLKFVIVDPKRVEMTLYTALRDHYLAVSPDINESIVTSPQNAVIVLKALVEEMQQRFSILAAAGQRNISDYNQKVRDGKIKDKGGIIHRPMPFIVVIIDELADLMMTASKEVEEPICRLAQLARAVGIHCIVATQRPSVDVVTGLIKANFPARIAYQVSSRIDSRTILDGTGAEHLIGNGDMLFAPGNTPMPIRMQNAFISTEEVEAICEWIGGQEGYSTPYMLPSVNKRGGGGGSSDGDRDVLFEDAARIFIQLQQASTSTLQRRLKIGYARAARIVDELEMTGIVGPPDGSRGRPVLLQSESELEAYL